MAQQAGFPGMNVTVGTLVKVAGVSHGDRQRIVGDLIVGENLEIRREPENEHDPNACAVWTIPETDPGAIAHGGSSPAEQVGYLAREVAASIAPVLDGGGWKVFGKVHTLYPASHSSAAGVRIELRGHQVGSGPN